MALAIAKSDTAHYLHATLERLETVAIQDINRLFYATAAHVAVEQAIQWSPLPTTTYLAQRLPDP
jgi:hypothetical protein